ARMRNGNSRTESIVYMADLSTAKIKTLELTNNKAVADGQAKNIAVATVADQFDNRVENFPLTASADNGATVADPNQQTDDNGQVTFRFSSETAGDSNLEIKGTGTTKSVTALFIADISTAKIQSVTVETENDLVVANGQAKHNVLVTVTDNRNNLLAGAPVTISVPGTARYQTQPVSGITDNQGRLRVFITNTKAGSEDYTFSINDSSVTRQLVFKPDESTATMTDSQLKIVDDDQKADGTAVNRVQATVLDAYGNRIPGYSVQFIADNDAVPPQSQLTTDSNGESVFELTNTNAGKTKVTAQVNGKTAFVNVTFTADSATAEILDGNMTVPVNNKPADGVAQNTVKVIVTDKKENRVPFVSVTFSTDPAAKPAGETSLTNEKGEAFFSLSSTVATDIMVTAKVNDNTMSKPATFVPGSAVPSMSLIRTNQETYIAGSDLTVTVTLKDAEGNGISGQEALLTEKTVIVPNAAIKAGDWDDKGNGEYERVYTAEKSGTNLKASLKPDSWDSAVHSPVYAITAGSVAQTTSQVITDKQSYTAGKDIKVTVMLKDTYGNSVTGQVSSLTAQTVIVPNTGEKAGSDWSDRNDGSYERNYTAKNESANNKVSVKLDGWTTPSESLPYSITIGGVEQSASGVRVDKGTYTAGDDITVTVTLKDGQGNGIRGQEAALLTEKVVIVPNAAEKADVWTYKSDGEYERVYTAQKASTGNKVSLKLDDWGSAAESGVYAVTADKDHPASGESVLTADKEEIVANDTDKSELKLTLRDASGNLISGQTVKLKTTLKNAVITMTPGDQNGVYTGTLKGTTAGTATVTVTVNETELAGLTKDIILIGDENQLSSSKSKLEVAPDRITADDTDASALKLMLRDVNDNPITGQTVEFITELDRTTITDQPESPQGTYHAVLKGKTAGNAEIKVKVNRADFGVASKTVKLVADKSTAKMVITNLNQDKHAVADTVSVNNVEVKVVDAHDNPISGVKINVTEKTQPAMVMIDNAEGVTGADGVFKPGVRSKIQNVSLSVSAKDTGGIDLNEDYALIFDLVKFTLNSAIVTD
ncbi:Ig-like domain-containing protein, partial [Morganella morganii]